MPIYVFGLEQGRGLSGLIVRQSLTGTQDPKPAIRTLCPVWVPAGWLVRSGPVGKGIPWVPEVPSIDDVPE